MTDCEYCGQNTDGIFHKCKFCGGIHCSKHLLPELHNCQGLERYKEKNQEKWEKTLSDTYSSKKDITRKNPTGYKKEKNVFKRTKNKLEYFFLTIFENLGNWLNHRDYNRYNIKKRINYLTITIFIFITSIIGFSIFYSNAQKLNNINLWILKLGGILILISLFFIIKYGWKLVKEIINLLKRQRNWIKYLIIILAILLLYQTYLHKDTVLNPVFNSYNKTNFSLFAPISLGDLDISDNSNNSDDFNNVVSYFTGPKIDDAWVHNFISIVNDNRAHPLQESSELNTIAQSRFNKMMENPFVSHYGAEAYNVGEVIFYPEGYTEQDYADNIKQTAPLHWEGLIDPSVSKYGYYIKEGPTLAITNPNSCPTTEIPGPNINEEDFFRQHGCTTVVEDSTWLVIDMS